MDTKAWSLKKIYYYLVSFVTLMMIVVGTVGVIKSSINLLITPPDPAYPTKVEYLRKYEEPGVKEQVSKEELEKSYQEDLKRQRDFDEYNRKMEILRNLALLVVGAPVYFYHWRVARKLEE